MGKKKASKTATDENSDQTQVPEADSEANFEQSLAEVEKVVEQLESGELSLDDSLGQYERGVKSLRRCFEHLRRAERKIEILVGFDDQGQTLTEPFADHSETLVEKQANRGARRGIQKSPAKRPAKSPEFSGFDQDSADDESDFDGDGPYMDESPGLF